ncbi:uncharacterized protein LOC144715107 isoform X2 [Wolffia australiana]
MAGSLPFFRCLPLQKSSRLAIISLPQARSCRVFSSVNSGDSSVNGPASFLEIEDGPLAKKKLVSLTPALYKYLLAHVREDPILRELREETACLPGSQMQVSPEQAQLLAVLVQILGAQNCIEVGVFTGYSSLAIASALPESGRLVACEKDAKCLQIAKKYYECAGVSHKVDVRQGPAVDTLRTMVENGESSRYDFAFVDADKRSYDQYFELLLQLVRIGGVIVVDNVLWLGKVADPLVTDKTTVSIRNFNDKIFNDRRVNISMVPIGDGITICRKVSD